MRNTFSNERVYSRSNTLIKFIIIYYHVSCRINRLLIFLSNLQDRRRSFLINFNFYQTILESSPRTRFMVDIKKLFYYINTNEIPGELSRENLISSHVKISPLLWLHNKSRLSHQKTIKVYMTEFFLFA